MTVLKELRERLPSANYVYVADTARVPYGRKPAAMVRDFAYQITGFLLERQVSAIVIACNTACSAALPELAESAPVPVYGVIEPSVDVAARATRSGRVGVIGTRATIASQSYQKMLERRGVEVWAKACPMLVHVAEEGLVKDEEAELLVRHYLDGRPDVDTLILGCTHYPILKDVIQRVVGDGVTLVSCATAVSEVIASRFEARPEGEEAARGTLVHMPTGDPAAYRHTSELIGKGVEGTIRPLDIATLQAFSCALEKQPKD